MKLASGTRKKITKKKAVLLTLYVIYIAFILMFTIPYFAAKDPIVEEIRAIRQQHAARFNYDLKKIAEDLRKKQERSGRKGVSFPSKPARSKATG